MKRRSFIAGVAATAIGMLAPVLATAARPLSRRDLMARRSKRWKEYVYANYPGWTKYDVHGADGIVCSAGRFMNAEVKLKGVRVELDTEWFHIGSKHEWTPVTKGSIVFPCGGYNWILKRSGE